VSVSVWIFRAKVGVKTSFSQGPELKALAHRGHVLERRQIRGRAGVGDEGAEVDPLCSLFLPKGAAKNREGPNLSGRGGRQWVKEGWKIKGYVSKTRLLVSEIRGSGKGEKLKKLRNLEVLSHVQTLTLIRI
jgi:hypothetical protein